VSAHAGFPRFIKVEGLGQAGDEDSSRSGVEFAVGLFTIELLALKKPHNLVFAQRGTCCYILPRSKKHPQVGWTGICGLLRSSEASLAQSLLSDVSVEQAVIDLLISSFREAVEPNRK